MCKTRCSFIVVLFGLLFTWNNQSNGQQTTPPKAESIKKNDSIQTQSQPGFGSSSLIEGLLESETLPAKPLKPSASSESVSESQRVQENQASLPKQIKNIVDGMQSAAEQMSAPKFDSGSQAEVLAMQDKVLQELDQLFQMLSMQSRVDSTNSIETSSESISSAESQATKTDEQEMPDSANPKSGQTPEAPPKQSEDEANSGQSIATTGNESESGSSNSSSERQAENAMTNGVTNGMPVGETAVDLLDSIEQSGQANWGRLPERLREKLSNSKSFVIPKGYEQAVREYYKYLNEAVSK